MRRNAALTAEQLDPGRYLAIEDGGEVVVIAVGEGVLRVGRGIGADVVLEDRSVSRRHAVITCRDGEVVLLDDRSLNGVWVNGERVAPGHAARRRRGRGRRRADALPRRRLRIFAGVRPAAPRRRT